MEELLINLKKRVWITKCCRFNAAKRYETHNRYANITTSMLACYVVILNICQLAITFSKENSSIITAITIGISVFLVAISLFVWARDFSVKAVKFHNCGRELASFEYEIDLILSEKLDVTKEQVKGLSAEYNAILNRYDNHEKIDLISLHNECKSEFPEQIGKSECWYSFKVGISYFFQVYFIYLLLLVGVPLGTIFLLIF